MKRLALILTVIALLVPSQVFAQRNFWDGFNRGLAQSRGQYVPPPAPPTTYQSTRPQSGTLYGPNGQTYLYQMNPGGGGMIYGPNGQTYIIQGN